MTTMLRSLTSNWTIVAAVAVLGVAAMYAGDTVTSVTHPVLINLGYVATSGMAAIVLFAAARALAGRERVAWSLVAAGLLSWCVANGIWAVYALVLETVPPYPGLPDLFWILAYPLWFAAVLVLPYASGGRYERIRLAIDGLVGSVAGALLVWFVFLQDVLYLGGETLLERIVNPAYPLGDLLVLAGVLVLAIRRSSYRFNSRLVYLGAAMLSSTTADILYLVNFDTYATDAWYVSFWVLNSFWLVLAARSLGKPVVEREYADGPSGFLNLIAPYALVVGAVGVAMWLILTGHLHFHDRVFLVGSMGVGMLVVGRQVAAIREQREIVEGQRRDLISSISHELRTPLTAVLGFTGVLHSDWEMFDNATRQDLVSEVNEQTHYLARIVTDLIEVSRDHLDSAVLHKESFDLADALDEAWALTGITGVRRPDVEVVAGQTVVGDRERIMQMLVNLLVNAYHYGDGQILLSIRQQDGVSIEVHDNGSGVPVKYQRSIWDRFERGVHRFDAERPGTGLGLPIVLSLAQAHGGSATYRRSDRLGGACFTINLPDSKIEVPDLVLVG